MLWAKTWLLPAMAFGEQFSTIVDAALEMISVQ
jgi:hypothetical protein